MIALSFMIISSASAQVDPIQIILHVDTENVTSDNIAETCNFGQDPSISNEEFLVHVALGDEIIWEGVSSTNPDGDVVEIKLIKYEGGRRVLNKERLTDSNNDPGRVRGNVVQGDPNDEQKYMIRFKVFNDGQPRGVYTIDPKLRIQG